MTQPYCLSAFSLKSEIEDLIEISDIIRTGLNPGLSLHDLEKNSCFLSASMSSYKNMNLIE